MDIRNSRKRKSIIRVDNYPEQAALVYATPKPLIELSIFIGIGNEAREEQESASETEPFGSKYPFELKVSVRSLKKIRDRLAKEPSLPADKELAFGRIAVLTTADNFLQNRQ